MKKEVTMGDFASFNGGKNNNQSEKEQFMKDAANAAARFQGKNEGDLVREIYARAAEGKKNGTLTNAEIDAFFRQISPMLDGAKRKRLEKLVEKLKEL